MKKLKKQMIIPWKSLGVPHCKPQGGMETLKVHVFLCFKVISFHSTLEKVILAGSVALASGPMVCLSQ